MLFTMNKQTGVAKSDCGFYEIRSSLVNAKTFYNAYYLPAHRHIEAGFDKEAVKNTCAEHAARIAALKQPEPQYDMLRR